MTPYLPAGRNYPRTRRDVVFLIKYSSNFFYSKNTREPGKNVIVWGTR